MTNKFIFNIIITTITILHFPFYSLEYFYTFNHNHVIFNKSQYHNSNFNIRFYPKYLFNKGLIHNLCPLKNIKNYVKTYGQSLCLLWRCLKRTKHQKRNLNPYPPLISFNILRYLGRESNKKDMREGKSNGTIYCY